MICPCRQQQTETYEYEDCCQRFHIGNTAPTPELLMRSRYSGFVLGLTNYIKKTWHPDTRPEDINLTPDHQWKKLDIVSASNQQVHFKAYLQDDRNQFQCLEEVSNFEIINDCWVYVDGEVTMLDVQLQRNDTCLCGSGKKFKKCCGK